MKVGVTGATGFVGSNLLDELEQQGIDYVGSSRKTGVDASDRDDLYQWIDQNKITHLINLAAECGGIGLNQKRPADLWRATCQISANVLDVSRVCNIKHLIMVGTICSYPCNCPIPFKEEYLMNYGEPEPTNLAYGISKLSALYGAQAYARQYKMNITNLIPVNMYAQYDNFDLETSHVIPAIIRKMYKAKIDNSPSVTLWGTGSASREFLHARDFSKAAILALEKDTGSQFINIGTGSEITIKLLASKIANIVGYTGEIIWDATKPDGQPRRCLDISRAQRLLGYQPTIKLEDGLRSTIEWFINKQ